MPPLACTPACMRAPRACEACQLSRRTAHGQFRECDACTEANATRHTHNTVHYKPTHAGRLIHADIAGPF
eukprot:3341180-Pleurochrysis_carterae.AAC.1